MKSLIKKKSDTVIPYRIFSYWSFSSLLSSVSFFSSFALSSWRRAEMPSVKKRNPVVVKRMPVVVFPPAERVIIPDTKSKIAQILRTKDLSNFFIFPPSKCRFQIFTDCLDKVNGINSLRFCALDNKTDKILCHNAVIKRFDASGF